MCKVMDDNTIKAVEKRLFFYNMNVLFAVNKVVFLTNHRS